MTINIYKTQNIMHQSLPQSPQSTELKEVLENYVAGLQDLTDSAKVPINILTMIAEENKIVASEIVRIIEVRLQTAQPEHRLATLHLLDSIIKNVKEPYLSLFAQNIVTNFITTFSVVNLKTQDSMLRLLQTWKDIYPVQYTQISAIISSRRAVPTTAAPVPKVYHQPQPSAAMATPFPFQPIQENINQKINLPTPNALPVPVLPSVTPQTNIPFIGGVPAQIPLVNPQQFPQQYYPPAQANQNELLQKLYDRLREQLIATQYTSSLQSTQNISTAHPSNQQSFSTPSLTSFSSDQPKETQNISRHKQKPNKNKRSPTHSPTHSSIRSPTQSPTSRSPTHPSTRSPPYSTRSPTHSPSYSSSHSIHPSSQRTHLVDLKDRNDIDNKNKTFSIGTSFSRDVLKRKHSHVINNLYNASWSQCPSCAFRFADPNKLSDHLDWHFKMNRREKEKFKKPMSREWFPPTDEWIVSENPESFQKPSAPGFFDAPTEVTKEKKKVKAIVKVDGFGVSCPVCGEGFESFYDSDEDEWMYKDAVDIDGVLYHDACSPDQPFEGLGKRQEHPTNDQDHFASKQFKLDY